MVIKEIKNNPASIKKVSELPDGFYTGYLEENCTDKRVFIIERNSKFSAYLVMDNTGEFSISVSANYIIIQPTKVSILDISVKPIF